MHGAGERATPGPERSARSDERSRGDDRSRGDERSRGDDRPRGGHCSRLDEDSRRDDRSRSGERSRHARGRQRGLQEPASGPGRDEDLVRIHDLAGRPRGSGFVADHHGTVITSHETVDGLPRLVLRAGNDRSCVVSADAVTPLPELDLALVRTEGLGVDPLPVSVRGGAAVGAYVRLPAGCWREARVLDATTATYTATDRFHLVDGTLELAIGTAGRDALRLGGGAAGGPVLDAVTGAVVAVLGTALQNGHRDIGFAVPLRVPGAGLSDDRLRVPGAGAADGRLRGQEAGAADDRLRGQRVEADDGRLRGQGVGAADEQLREAGAGAVDEQRRREPGAGSLGDSLRDPGSESLGGPLRGTESGSAGGAFAAAGSGSLGGPPPASEPFREPIPGLGLLAALLAENAATVPAYGDDLNLAGVLELTATSVGQDGPAGVLDGYLGRTRDGRAEGAEPVERASVVREFAAFAEGRDAVLGLVGPPGSGRTTELAALTARRHRSSAPAPTLWLRGADLRDEDASVADAARRALGRAARIVASAADTVPADLGDITPERLARLAHAAGRPLFLLLDGPEEMPPVLAHRLADWTDGTATWLRETGARLVVACREEYWQGAGFPEDVLHGEPGWGAPADEGDGAPARSAGPGRHGGGGRRLPRCVRLGDLAADEARRARARYGVPEGALVGADARHPLTLRLLSEVRAALPGAPQTPADRHDVFSAHLDLMCLRVAVRLAAEQGLRGTAVRRLAAKVAGQVHEAARRSLGPGQGELDRESFEAVFPWGPAPARLGGGTGWASAVLTEGLLVPAGTGYRFAHEELADWIQGTHLDLEEALRTLVHRPRPHPLPVPRHRIGPVVQALLLVARQQGTPRLAHRLEELLHALDADPHSWWAARLLAEVLLRVPDATPYTDVLRQLTDRIVDRRGRERAVPGQSGAGGGSGEAGPGTLGPGKGSGEAGPGEGAVFGSGDFGHGQFGPEFWIALPVPDRTRFDLLRRLVLADGPPQEPGPRFLDTVAELLAADPTAVQPHLACWFDDERPLPATPHATVAKAAQALLHTHRTRALDDLTEILVGRAHRRADELLAVLAEDEPSAVCRAVDRWAHDERPARRVAAVAYGLRAAPHVRTEPDRELLRYAALALLSRPEDCTLHGGALALLVRDPRTRARHLPQALGHFAAGDPQFPASALVPALATDPEPVLDAFRERLRRPEAGEALRTLADVTTPALARRVAALVREAVRARPETAGDMAAYVDRRLDHGPAVRAVLRPLVTGLLDGGPERVRAALAAVLAAPGAPESRPLRAELLDFLLDREREPAVLAALLPAAARRGGEPGDDVDDVRHLVHRTGLLLVRTPEGASLFDRGLVDLGRHVPGFAALVAGWLTDTPQEWAAVVGPGTRRMIENLAGHEVRVSA